MAIPEDFKRRDDELRHALQENHPDALSRVISAYGHHVRRVLRDTCHRLASEEDLSEQVMDVFWEFSRKYVLGRQVWPFLLILTRRRGIDLLRRTICESSRIRSISFDESDSTQGGRRRPPLEEVETRRQQLSRAIAHAATGLTEREATAFWRRFFSGDRYGWASRLAQEQGGNAGAWRKASADACAKMKTLLGDFPEIRLYLEESA